MKDKHEHHRRSANGTGPLAQFQIGDWQVDADPSRTSAIYAASQPGADFCGCYTCTSYVTARESAFPEVARSLFAKLGIDWAREEEVIGGYRYQPNLWMFNGWFHFLGHVLAGPEMGITQLTPRFWFFVRPAGFLPSFLGFKGQECGEIEFIAFVEEGSPGFEPPVAPDDFHPDLGPVPDPSLWRS